MRCLRTLAAARVARKGKRRYPWAEDGKPGERTGDGFDNARHVAKP